MPYRYNSSLTRPSELSLSIRVRRRHSPRGGTEYQLRYAGHVRASLGLLLLVLFGACATRSAAPESAIRSGNGFDVRAFALRLRPGDDLRTKLTQFAAQRSLHAAHVITCVGSLKVVAIRFADQQSATVLEGPFEIVSLVGTLSTDGPHLHLSVSDSSGRTFGGHLSEGSLVYTTAEVVIGDLVGARFARETDPATASKELIIK